MGKIGPYDSGDAGKADGIMELGIYCSPTMRNSREFYNFGLENRK